MSQLVISVITYQLYYPINCYCQLLAESSKDRRRLVFKHNDNS